MKFDNEFLDDLLFILCRDGVTEADRKDMLRRAIVTGTITGATTIMADSRYKNGCFVNGRGKVAILEDCPLYHGWQVIKRCNGYRIWQLEDLPNVQMRRVQPGDPKDAQGREWLVFVDGEVFAAYDGSLAQITQDIRDAVGPLPSYECGISQEQDEAFGEEATPWEQYGLGPGGRI